MYKRLPNNELGKIRQSHLISGRALIFWHAFFVIAAFLIALIIGIKKHYIKIVTNQYYTYPNEWIPSVSATIGDRFPGRNFFQYLMAAAAIPRMILAVMFWHVYQMAFEALPPSRGFRFQNGITSILGIIRVFAAGAWIYVPSGDWNLFHDITMVVYLAITIIYHAGLASLKSDLLGKGGSVWKESLSNRLTSFCFLCTLPIATGMIYFFIQHKVNIVPGGNNN